MIYLDNAATTRLSSSAFDEMIPYLKNDYGNASAVYALGSKSRCAIDRARDRAAKLISAKPSEIYFTSGGSEADNWALTSVFEAFSSKGKHIITTSVEHHAVLRTCDYLKERGAEITILPVDDTGRIDVKILEAALRPDTILVSVMTANNEVGTIQPIAEIGKVLHERNILFHTDAVQAYGHIPINVGRLHIDLLSASAHKLNGPKGVGLLYIRDGVRIRSLIHGGSQERSRRAGTENTAGIVGFGKAAEEAMLNMTERTDIVTELRDLMIDMIEHEIPDVVITGNRADRLPNNINILIPGIDGETALIELDMKGIAASSGAACSAGALDPSHVLLAMGYSYEEAQSSIRLSLSHENTIDELEQTAAVLKQIADRR